MADRFKACSVDGCNGNAHRDASGKRGYCNRHYLRVLRHGAPETVLIAEAGEPLRFVDDLVREGSWTSECIAWPYGRRDGYGTLKIGGRAFSAHRLICERVHGPAPSSSHEVRHLCGKGIQGCVNPAHLAWGTHAENMADMAEHGSRTVARGERQGLAKLKQDQVRAIRAELQSGRKRKDVAERYGMSEGAIYAIEMRHTWAWLE